MTLLLALLLDAALGEPRLLWDRLPHPAVLMGRAVAALDRRLNEGDGRRPKGVLAVALLVGGAGALGWPLFLRPIPLAPSEPPTAPERPIPHHCVPRGCPLMIVPALRNPVTP